MGDAPGTRWKRSRSKYSGPAANARVAAAAPVVSVNSSAVRASVPWQRTVRLAAAQASHQVAQPVRWRSSPIDQPYQPALETVTTVTTTGESGMPPPAKSFDLDRFPSTAESYARLQVGRLTVSPARGSAIYFGIPDAFQNEQDCG
ncbi:hypothetical protein CDD83_7682 [Cordyceps sp. RAO-2017]|nr:hypothetical protein CDD83_7682 [Cordyceps sp. RAO-2017]